MFEAIPAWGLLLQIVSMTAAGVWGWASLRTQVNSMRDTMIRIENEQDCLDKRVEKHIEDSTKAREDIAGLKSDMRHVKESLTRIEQHLLSVRE